MRHRTTLSLVRAPLDGATRELTEKEQSMSVIISAASSTPRNFSEAQNDAIDAKSISVSEGNWLQHLTEYSIPAADGDPLCIHTLSKEVDDFIFFYDGKSGISDHLKWHIALAEQLRDLIAVGIANGCDRIGITG